MIKKIVSLFIIITVLSACSSQQHSIHSSNNEPAIVKLLPVQITNYKYSGYRLYGKGLGYSLRYKFQNENYHFADIYIWPAPERAKKYSHKEIVYGVTDSGIRDIYSMQEKGHYNNVKILEKRAYTNKNNTLTMHKITMLRGNVESLSFLYVTEFNGILLKARISMPDNTTNRGRKDIKEFAIEIFNKIIKNIKHA